MSRIEKLIKCKRTIEIINKYLKAGYIDPNSGRLIKQDVGTPQESLLSPLLCNIVAIMEQI
jgi:retron-type reverse transcriptase